MKISLHKNQKGFSHHFIMPVLAIFLVAGIGSYVMLRSSSAATSYKDCSYKTLGSSTVHCRVAMKSSDTSKSYYLYYDLHWQRTDAKYKYLKITLKNSTKKFDKGKTTFKTTPFTWSVNCFNDKDVSTFETKLHFGKGGVTKIPKKYIRCGTNAMYNFYQYGPVDGYVYKSTAGFSKTVYLK